MSTIRDQFSWGKWLLCFLLMSGCGGQSAQKLVEAGEKAAAQGDHLAAQIQYKAALQKDPQLARARQLLGASLMRAGQFEQAIIELTKLGADRTHAQLAIPLLAEALVEIGDHRRLVQLHGATVLGDRQADAQLQTQLGRAWLILGQRTKAEAAVLAALREVPDYAPARLLGARILASTGQTKSAAELVSRVLQSDEANARAWLLKGELTELGEASGDSAEAAYRRSIALEPRCLECQAALITLLLRRNDLAAARQQAAVLKQVFPTHAYTLLLETHFNYLDGNMERANELVQALLKQYPDNPVVLVLAGSIDVRLGNHGRAAAHLGKAMNLSPTLTQARVKLAEAEVRLGRHEEALATLKPLTTSEKPPVDALAIAGEANLRLGNVGAAEQLFVRASKLDPANMQIRTSVALARLRGGDSASGLSELQSIAERSKGTFADEALLAAHLRRREHDAALTVIDRMSSKVTDKAFLAELRGRVLWAKRELPAARASFEAAHKQDPAQFGAVGSLAAMDLAEGNPEKGIERLAAFTRAQPANGNGWTALAEMKSRHGNVPAGEIKALFEEAIKVAPTAREPRRRLVEFLLRKRLLADAVSVARAAADAFPDDPVIIETLGLALLRSGAIEQALSAFRQLAGTQAKAPQPYVRLAEGYMAGGRRDQAEVALRQAIELDPSYAPAHAMLVDVMLASRRPRDALNHIRRLRDARPGQPVGYVLESVYHSRMKDLAAAIAVLKEGLVRATVAGDIPARLFSLYIQANRAAEAEQFARSWLVRSPGDPSIEYLLSVFDIGKRDYAQAEQRLLRVVAAEPGNAPALNNLAWLLVETGKPGAIAYARRALDLSPDQPAYLDTLALALAADTQIAAAMAVQRAAVELAPANDQLRLTLARLALQSGDKALARGELERLQKLGAAFPRHAEVAKLMAQL
jgi:putative PEP-CTERM system TPR-repeat lipoprotein